MVDPNPELAAAGVVSRIPEIAVREIESVLRLRSGEVAVLGGLMREEAREDTAGVPLLSRLPGIGAAFRYRDRTRDKTELIVFLRPTVVREPDLAGDLGRYRRWWPAGDGPVTTGAGPGHHGREPAGEAAATGRNRRPRTPEAGSGSTAPLPETPWTVVSAGPGRRSGGATTAPRGPPTSGRSTPARRRRFPASPPSRSARGGTRRPARGTSASPPLPRTNEIARTMSFVLDRGKGPEARERELARRVSLAPDAAWLQVALGNALAAQGKPEAAEDAWRAARRAAPSNPDPAYNLAVNADRLARPRVALDHYRDALDLAALSPPAFDVGAVRERVAALEGLAEGARS